MPQPPSSATVPFKDFTHASQKQSSNMGMVPVPQEQASKSDYQLGSSRIYTDSTRFLRKFSSILDSIWLRLPSLSAMVYGAGSPPPQLQCLSKARRGL